MFVDFNNAWPPPEPWQPKRPPRRVTKRQERMIGWIVGLNLLMLLVGPFAGATIFDAIFALVRG
ncbi:hypothetical protein [Sphingomonas bacterium]|uniref:hypothetical protein n=1 Tax=Sphingomonas bacterium TaxID=1895847 RepID=UPI001576118C|nr:hypothetical protein [Sphingomonas bacterium]